MANLLQHVNFGETEKMTCIVKYKFVGRSFTEMLRSERCKSVAAPKRAAKKVATKEPKKKAKSGGK